MKDLGRAAGSEVSHPFVGGIVRRAFTVAQTEPEAVGELRRHIGDEPLALLLVFTSPRYDRDALARSLGEGFPGTAIIGCTTAGEITGQGYAEGHIVAIGLPSRYFVAAIHLIEDLDAFDARATTRGVLDLRTAIAAERPDWPNDFFLLLADGLARKEDQIVAALAQSTGPIPLFGGSAGDGLDFRQTFVLHGGRFRSNAALLALVRTCCGVRVFCFDHLVPSETRMVVTEAIPEERLVREINAEPAAREYARMVGKDPYQLSPFIFAAHPVVVRIGGKHHVRAIQKVEESGDLRFYSAIDEGLVLTVAEAQDIVRHLDGALDSLATGGRPDTIIGCDCILRRLEAEQNQAVGELSRVLARHGVVGFSTYGEQYNQLHVNQTLTGVAIYAPGILA
ncbi:MAG TPA: FIST N-terminal domain-containing protein [Paracoccaceae bacterium]|nr:FIST N-terminal domain-containing protein [Paracoccaceae bacterium]